MSKENQPNQLVTAGRKGAVLMEATWKNQYGREGTVKPERYITIKEMAERGGFSESFFTTNASLARHGKPSAKLPPLIKIGRNVRCKESEFYRWMDGNVQEVAA